MARVTAGLCMVCPHTVTAKSLLRQCGQSCPQNCHCEEKLCFDAAIHVCFSRLSTLHVDRHRLRLRDDEGRLRPCAMTVFRLSLRGETLFRRGNPVCFGQIRCVASGSPQAALLS